jgi:3-methyladenine DNA glycosylase AlkD
MPDLNTYIAAIRKHFEANADPELASWSKKYLRNQYEFFGIKTPLRREIVRQFFRERGLPGQDKLGRLIRTCWELPERDFQYFALAVADKFYKKATPEFMEDIEFMILNKSWWDTVDYIAAVYAGSYFKKYHGRIVPVTGAWMTSRHLWLQRSALLFQLKYKDATDTDMLSDYIQRLNGSREFFINKAIGWVLREYSKTDPDWVRSFVNSHQLAPLSVREALRRIQ